MLPTLLSSSDAGVRHGALQAAALALRAPAVGCDVFSYAECLLSGAIAAFAIPPVIIHDAASSNVKLVGPRVDAVTALLIACVSSPRLLAREVKRRPFWRIVHWALGLHTSGSRDSRKAGAALLRNGLAVLRDASPVDDSAGHQWDTLVTLLEATEDFPLHLLRAQWDTCADVLIPPRALSGAIPSIPIPTTSAEADTACESPLHGVAYGSAADSADVPVPSFSSPLPFVWAALALDRLLHHENPSVARHIALHILREAAGPSPFATPLADAELRSLGDLASSQHHTQLPLNTQAPGLPMPSEALFALTAAHPDVAHGSYAGICTAAFSGSEYVPLRASAQVVGVGGVQSGGAEAGATPLLLRCPPWYVAGASHLLGILGSGALLSGAGSIVSPSEQAVRGAYVAYMRSLLPPVGARDQRPLLLCAFLRCLIAGVHTSRVLQSKPGLWCLFRTLSAGIVSLLTPASLPVPALDALALAHVRRTIISVTLCNSRVACEVLLRSIAAFVRATTDPASVPLGDLAHTLALFPVSIVLAPEGVSAENCGAASLFSAWLEGAHLWTHLQSAIASYISGTRDSTQVMHTPLTAVGLARLFCMLPKDGAAASAAIEPLAKMLAARGGEGSSSNPQAFARALLLVHALCAQAWPGGGSGDQHLSRGVSGCRLTPELEDAPSALGHEFAAATRHAQVVFPQTMDAVVEPVDSPAAPVECGGGVLPPRPRETDVEACGELMHATATTHVQRGVETCAQRVMTQLLSQPAVGAIIACVVQGAIASSFDGAEGAPRNSTPSSFALALLRNCLVATRCTHGVPSGEVYVDAAAQLLRASLDTLAATSIPSPLALPPSLDPLVRMVRAGHALRTLAACTLPSLLDAVDGHAARALLMDALSITLTARFAPPRGATDATLQASVGTGETSTITLAALRIAHEGTRWSTLACLVQLLAKTPPHGKSGHSCSRLLSLPVSLAHTLASAACDAVDVCSSDAAPDVLCVVGHVLAALPLSGEEWGGEEGAIPLSPDIGLDFVGLLKAMERLVWQELRPGRRLSFYYAAAVAQPSLFLRAQLHSQQEQRGGPLLHHLSRAFIVLAGENRPAHMLQALTARLVSVWQHLVRVADAAALNSASASARTVLQCHAPVMLALALHRDALLVHDDPLLLDSAARSQCFSWLAARAAQRQRNDASPLVFDPQPEARALSTSLLGVSEQEVTLDITSGGDVDECGSELLSRGAGALVRIQVLCFLDELASSVSAWRRTQMPASPASAVSVPIALMLQRTLSLHLARILTVPEWLSETAPGRTDHQQRLRSLQTLAVVASTWGAGGAGGDAGYDVRGDVWAVEPPMLSDVAAAWSVTVGREAGVPPPGVPIVIKKVVGAKIGKAISVEDSHCGFRALLLSTPAHASSSFTTGDVACNTPTDDHAVAAAILRSIFHQQLLVPQLPGGRHYLESIAVALSRRFPALAARVILLPGLADYNARAQSVFSTVLVSSDLTRHLARLIKERVCATLTAESATRRVAKSLIKGLLAWSVSSVGLIRVISQVALNDALPSLFPSVTAGADAHAAGGCGVGVELQEDSSSDALEWLMPQLAYLRHSTDVMGMVTKVERQFLRVTPSAATTLAAILCSPVTEHGELVPRDVFSYVHGVFASISAARHAADVTTTFATEATIELPSVAAALRAGILPRAARQDLRLRWPFGVEGGVGVYEQAHVDAGSSDVSRNAALAAAEGNFQRKISSKAGAGGGNTSSGGEGALPTSDAEDLWRVAMAVLGGAAGAAGGEALAPHSATLARRNAGASEGGDGHGAASSDTGGVSGAPSRALLLPSTDSSGRPHQELIICASLVNKAANLGGLARTAEIFGAACLVIPDNAIKNDPLFSATSLTAEQWVPIHDVHPHDLEDYVRARRAQGWGIVALEQAARSVRLGSRECVLPSRMLLLLGAEKEGLPPELLALADVVVEIMQLGLLRSLNVHVAAALVIQEYTTQRARGSE